MHPREKYKEETSENYKYDSESVVIFTPEYVTWLENKLKYNNMEKRFKINIPEGFEIDKEKSSFEEIVFKEKESKLPMSWEELTKIEGWYIDSVSTVNKCNSDILINDNKNIFPSKEEAEASLALAQLCQLRDAWNEGWKPDWNDTTTKYAICSSNYHLIGYTSMNISCPIAFKTVELRHKFLFAFKDLLEIAKPLL